MTKNAKLTANRQDSARQRKLQHVAAQVTHIRKDVGPPGMRESRVRMARRSRGVLVSARSTGMTESISPSEIRNSTQVVTLDSWENFFELIRRHHHNCPAFLYRGHADAEWKVESMLTRLRRQYPFRRNYWSSGPEFFTCPPPGTIQRTLELFKELSLGKRGVAPQDLGDREWWALARHHGLATPLIDWTRSPFVALFFAFSPQTVQRCNGIVEPEWRAVIRVSVSAFSSNKRPPRMFVPQRETSPRLPCQAGVLLECNIDFDLRKYIARRYPSKRGDLHPQAMLEEIRIPNAGRVDCLKVLNKMNINQATLFRTPFR